MTTSRHVVVEGLPTQLAATDASAAHRAAREEIERQLQDAAPAATAAQLPLTGCLLLVLTPSGWGLLDGASPAGAAAWTLVAAATAAGLLTAPQWARARRARAVLPLAAVALGCAAAPLGAIGALAGLDAAGAPAGAAAVSVAASPSVLANASAAAAFGIAAAVALAPLPLLALLAAALPLLAGAAVAVGGGGSVGLALAAGAVASAAAAALAWRRHRDWRDASRTAIDQAERLRQLEQERDIAQRTDRDKSRFLAIASHDLRQPVHALGLFAATLHKRLAKSPDEPLSRYLVRAVDGLERSFNAMLDISRMDGGGLCPQLQTFPLRDMFRRLQMQYGGQAELAGLGLRFSPGGKSVTSDPQLLERIVGNLIQNAVKYTARGGIVVVARSTATHVNVEIWDTGCGIAAAELPRIFEEFYQVGRGERDRSHGLGMGLAIVKRLAALLEHRLEVHSTPGRGAMFRVGIPIGGLPGIQEELAPADTLPMTVWEPRMVLIVDDEEPIREGLRLLLQEWGLHAMTVADAAEAERAVGALEGRIDLILSDLHLGAGGDGQEVVASVRRLCARDVPAILITGATTPAEVRHLSAGDDPVLFKPVQPRRLFEAMRAVLG